MVLPARIGRYRILGLLGRGAMGVVYRGRDEGLDRDVAVKVMARAGAAPDGHDRFLREARSAARLQHPNIVIIYELVTGEKVYRADNVVSLLYTIAHEPPALAELPAGPQWRRLREVVTRALQREPEDRYPDARSMADELSQALADLGGAAPGPPAWDDALARGKAAGAEAAPAAMPSSAASEPREPSRRLALLALAGAAAALLAALSLFLFLRPSTGPRPESAAPSAAPTAPPGPSLAASPTPAAVASAPPPSPAREVPSPKPASPSPRPASTPAAGETEPRAGGDAARLEKASDLLERGRYAAALAEARAVLTRDPGNAEARILVEDSEAAMVVEDRIKKGREALRKGDREKALQEARAGLAVAPSDARLLALFKEATR